MGEGRGKLEALIADLEEKKAELRKLIEEYELMLPHLTSARKALDEAGIKDTGSARPSAPQPAAMAAAAAPPPPPPPPPPKAEKPKPAAEPAAAAPARRSIASLVAEEESAGDEATH